MNNTALDLDLIESFFLMYGVEIIDLIRDLDLLDLILDGI